MAVWGVDGCRGGWVAISSQREYLVAEDFRTLTRLIAVGRIYIDMPVGLTDDQPRRLEFLARSLLSGRSSSVFPVPCRSAVYANTYREACRINEARFGKKISLQAWNICPKIREIDVVLAKHPALQRRIFESHPELAFQVLNQGPLKFEKRSVEGAEERLNIVRPFLPGANVLLTDILKRYPRKTVARDDILDAMVLAVVGTRSKRRIAVRKQARDGRGIPIRMMLPKAVPATESL